MRCGGPILALVASLACGSLRASAADDALARAKAAALLSVRAAPVSSEDAGRHAGFDADLLGEIGKELGIGIRWLAPAGSAQGVDAPEAPALTGTVALTSAMLRRYRALPPVLDVSDALLKRKGDGSLLKPADVAGKAVGGIAGSPSLAVLRAFARTLPAAISVRAHTDADDVYADLAAGRVAAAVGDFTTLAVAAKARPDTFEVLRPPFGPRIYLGFVVAKNADHAALADAVAAVLLKMKADGRLAVLQVKWFGAVFDTPDALTDPGR